MKTLYNLSFVVVALFVLNSCNTGPQPIDYGNDGCHFCKMTIVDKIYGSQLISEKGKVFKFDATECMLNYIQVHKELSTASMYTNYYEAPTAFITMQEATFLITEKLPSPMGANLTAFKTKESAEKIQAEKGGKLYTWEPLKLQLNK